MKKLSAVSLLDILPESILLDPKLKASAQALDSQLQAVTNSIREVLHIPRLDELSGNILDYIAEQLHIDFYEPLYLTEDEKRNLIRESIAWHRIKGTPYAVEKIAHDAFADAEIVEWFDYDGEPYHFKVRSHGFKQTPDGWATYVRMLNSAKNVRSWCDNYELVLDEDVFGKNQAYAGVIDLRTGDKTISLDKPRLDSETKIFAGGTNLLFGNVTESLQRPKLKFDVPTFAGMILKKIGNVRIGTSTKPHDEADDFALECVSKIFAGTSTGVFGHKFWSLSLPSDEQVKVSAGNVDVIGGKIDLTFTPKITLNHETKLYADTALLKVGRVKINSSTPSSTDENLFGQTFTTNLHAANVTHKSGFVRLGCSSKRPESHKSRVRVGMINTFSGVITIGCSDVEDWGELPDDGDWLRLRFRFPNLSKRFVTLKNPRDDVQKSEIRDAGNYASDTELILNSIGESTTGIDLAMLIKRSERKIF